MNASSPACLSQTLQAERLSCVAIDPAANGPDDGATSYCRPLLALVAKEPQPTVPALRLLVLFIDRATDLPQWIAALAAEMQPQPDSGAWCVTLANGLPLTLRLCERNAPSPLPEIGSLLSAAPQASPALVCIDGENMPVASRHRDLPNWYWQLAERGNISLTLLACAAGFRDISEARKRAGAQQCLSVHIDATGHPVWQIRYYGYIAPSQLSPAQSRHLQSACLRINQLERLICERWLALDRELRQQQACGKACFESYQIDVDIQFLLRQDDPRWRANSDNGLLLLKGIDAWMGLIENYHPDHPIDFRNLTPDSPAQLTDYYQGRIFFCLHAWQELSWADIAAIGAVRFWLNVSYGFAATINESECAAAAHGLGEG